jgi:hypothetical protein
MIWREASVAKFRVITQHLYGGAEENYEEYLDDRCPDLAANRKAPDYKSGALQVDPKCPMKCARKTEKADRKRA